MYCVSYTNNQLSKREIKRRISFTVSSKRIKYLGINLTKEVTNSYKENYDNNESTRRWYK